MRNESTLGKIACRGSGHHPQWLRRRDGCCVVVVKDRDPDAEPLQIVDFDARVLPIVTELHEKGISATAIARILTARHVATRRGGIWTPQQVRGLLARAGLAALRSDRR